MVSNEAAVCNLALLNIGQRAFIDSLTENTPAGKIANLVFRPTRDLLLEAAHWKFARREVALALLSGETRKGWTYVYALPSDCISPRKLWDGKRSESSTIPFELADSATSGKVLLTDMEEATLIYTTNAVAVARWPQHFVEAVAWQLSERFALGLAVKPDVARFARDEARVKLSEAVAQAFREGVEDAPADGSTVTARA